jgi:hypothetical protein
VRVGNTFVAAVYHPPAPKYKQKDLLDYIEACIAEVSRDFSATSIVLAGDLNQLTDQDLEERTGLTQIVHHRTRGNSILDRVYISDPQLYSIVRVVASVVKSDHRAVVMYADQTQCAHLTKKTFKRTFRSKTPTQHALFLQHIAKMQQENLNNNMLKCFPPEKADTQLEFDIFYSTAHSLLNQFYPERTITVTSHDPQYVTPEIKAKLRRKNRLMRAGESSIRRDLERQSKNRLKTINGMTDVKDMWAAVWQLTGRKQDTGPVPGISAEWLNSHYVAISSDNHYAPPINKQSVAPSQFQYISSWRVFQIPPYCHRPDQLPAWFLRIGAPLFCELITQLFNLSLSTSTVPLPWKQAFIRPIAKVSTPSQPTDFVPISITPVLTRIMERTVVRRFLYPAFLSPPPSLIY